MSRRNDRRHTLNQKHTQAYAFPIYVIQARDATSEARMEPGGKWSSQK